MERTVLVVLVGNRKNAAVNVQKVLTEWGCLIKTRLGLHDGVLDDCSDKGLLIMELVGDTDKKQELSRKLSLINGVSVELVNMKVD